MKIAIGCDPNAQQAKGLWRDQRLRKRRSDLC